MATLTVLKFPTAEGATTMLAKLQDLQRQQMIQVQDAAIVTWPVGSKKPKTKQLSDFTGVGALSGAFWGLLFGLLFFVPIFGLAVGAASGLSPGTLLATGSTRISSNRCATMSQKAPRPCSC